VPLTVMYLEESTLWILVLIAALLTFRVWQVVDVTGHRTEKRIANIVCLEWYLRNTYGDVDPELEGQAVNVDWS